MANRAALGTNSITRAQFLPCFHPHRDSFFKGEMPMRRCLLVVSLMVLASVSTAQDEKSVVKDALQAMSDLTDALKTVKDKASAEAGLPKLKTLGKKLDDVLKAASKLSIDDEKLVAAKAQPLNAELSRIDKLPEARAVLKELPFYKKLIEAREGIARVQIKVLDDAVEAYVLSKSELPASLKALLEGNTPILKNADALLDPWKKPYQYDVNGPKNKNKRPDIWTVTPDKVIIGNWKKD
jgi:hypothetical protein